MIMKNLFKRIQKDNQGTAAIEFALIAPILVLMFIGVVELSNYMSVIRKISAAAHTAADLISQETDLSNTELNVLFKASRLVINPLDETILTLGAASVRYDVNDASPVLDWSGNYNAGSVSGATSLATGLGAAGESVIIVTATYAYTPLFDLVLSGTHTISETAIARPRYINYIGLY
jgi:Flp pilus assembly protein TadG